MSENDVQEQSLANPPHQIENSCHQMDSYHLFEPNFSGSGNSINGSWSYHVCCEHQIFNAIATIVLAMRSSFYLIDGSQQHWQQNANDAVGT